MAQIGTIRVDTQNNGTVSVPVFDIGDSGSSIYEFVRVQTGSGTGFIPVEDTSNATYPYLRVQSQSHGTVAMTDRSSALPDREIDFFEDGDLSEYTISKGIASVQQSVVHDGNDAISLDGRGFNRCELNSDSGDGLPNYPSQGDVFTAWVRTSDITSDTYVGYANDSSAGNPPAGYWVIISWNNSLKLERNDGGGGGTNATIASTSISRSAETWHKIRIDWGTDNTHTVELLDSNEDLVTEISGTDGTYTDGGIFYRAKEGVDYIDTYGIV